MDIRTAISKVTARKDLTVEETRSVFGEIMTGLATPSQIASFITALRMKGETVDEITGAAKVMREKAVKIRVKNGSARLIDTCGTGGTGTKAFNISTAAAFVVAGCGVKVAKHGNRAVSSHCGSADVLEELGIKIDVPASVIEDAIETIGIGFLFAPVFHGAMGYAALPRKEIGIRTVFNILGPLSNPAMAKRQVLGVYDEKLTAIIANVLKKLGSERAYVVHGQGPLDEVTVAGKTRVSELRKGNVRTYNLTPSSFGFKRNTIDSIKGGTVRENASIIKSVFSGSHGPKREVVLMNASLALMVADKAASFKEGVRMAAESIDSGAALKKLEELIKITNR